MNPSLQPRQGGRFRFWLGFVVLLGIPAVLAGLFAWYFVSALLGEISDWKLLVVGGVAAFVLSALVGVFSRSPE